MRGEVFKKAVGDYEYFVSDSDLISEYEKREMYLNGQSVMLQYERQEGLKEGLAEGIEKGALNAKLDMAKSALAKGFDAQTIAEFTGLSKEEILTLENKSI